MYSSIKVVFCWRFFSPIEDPLIFDDQFSTRFAIMFPQSLGFYILIHLMAVLNLRQYMLFAQFRSLFSSWQDKLLKSQPSSFSPLVFVLLWGESLAKEAVSTRHSGLSYVTCSPNPLTLLFPFTVPLSKALLTFHLSFKVQHKLHHLCVLRLISTLWFQVREVCGRVKRAALND